MEGKVCSKCKEFKLYDFYRKRTRSKDGYRSSCKNCDKKYDKENKEKIAKRKKEWFIKNKERLHEKQKQRQKEWYKNNKEKVKAYRDEWRLSNPDKYYAYKIKRKSHKNKVVCTKFKRSEILERDNYICQNCNVKVHDRSTGDWNDEFKAHLDHVIPISKGGDSTPENLRVLCRTCNLSKKDKTDIVIKEDGQIALFI